MHGLRTLSHRQEAILERAGLAIPRSTLAAWVGVCGVRLQPPVDAMKAELLACAVPHADETAQDATVLQSTRLEANSAAPFAGS